MQCNVEVDCRILGEENLFVGESLYCFDCWHAIDLMHCETSNVDLDQELEIVLLKVRFELCSILW